MLRDMEMGLSSGGDRHEVVSKCLLKSVPVAISEINVQVLEKRIIETWLAPKER